MFELEFFANSKNREIKRSGITFKDTFEMEFENACVILDNYIYLLDMFRIIQSCTDDLLLAEIIEEDYWKVNKLLLNYVNAIYSFKELADNFVPTIKPITEKYYNMGMWYRFVCDFRNSVVHESVISTEFSNDEIYIELDKLIDIQLHRKTTKPSQEDNRKRQIVYLEGLKKDAKVHDGRCFYGVKKICKNVRGELTDMQNEVVEFAFNKSVSPILNWILDLVHKDNDEFKYTFIVNKSTHMVYEPNHVLEYFYCRMERTMGKSHIVNNYLKELFEKKKYSHLFGQEI